MGYVDAFKNYSKQMDKHYNEWMEICESFDRLFRFEFEKNKRATSSEPDVIEVLPSVFYKTRRAFIRYHLMCHYKYEIPPLSHFYWKGVKVVPLEVNKCQK